MIDHWSTHHYAHWHDVPEGHYLPVSKEYNAPFCSKVLLEFVLLLCHVLHPKLAHKASKPQC